MSKPVALSELKLLLDKALSSERVSRTPPLQHMGHALGVGPEGVDRGYESLTVDSVELTRRAGTSLESITLAVSIIQLMNQPIAAAAE